MASLDGNDDGDIKPGHHDTEICYECEAELDKHHQDCKKNPGHVNFIPIQDFDYDHLPERYQDLDMMQVIQSLAALTVKLKVNRGSKDRPEHSSFFIGGFPFYTKDGNKSMRFGTGKIENACTKIRMQGGPNATCPCETCKTSGKRVNEWGEVSVVTATHVVFDEEEAKKTTVFIDWADEKTPSVTLNGTHMESSSVEGDRCEFICVTHDLELITKLQDMIEKFKENYRLVKERYIYNQSAKEENLVVIVSHPHGKAKKVTVGRVNKEVKWKNGMTFTKYSYTAPTCPGSSGAPVFVMGYNGWYLHTHGGTNPTENFSGVSFWFS